MLPVVPVLGVVLDTVGGPAGSVMVKPFVSVAAWVSGFVTTTFHAPIVEPAGIESVPVRVVADPNTTDETPISVLPLFFRLIVAPLTKPVPYTLIGMLFVPRVPEIGLMLMTDGALGVTVMG